jgi:cyclic pyranopterin phosphate synthase
MPPLPEIPYNERSGGSRMAAPSKPARSKSPQSKSKSSRSDAVFRAASGATSRTKLSHYDAAGRAVMVDVSAKSPTARVAEASAFVAMGPAVLAALPANPKGDPFEVARIAGIQAAKQTPGLIPMCHPLPLSFVDISYTLCEDGVSLRSRVSTKAETGVEMEALTAASVAALTIYDMCKALDKGMAIRSIQLERKRGGKSGVYRRKRGQEADSAGARS